MKDHTNLKPGAEIVFRLHPNNEPLYGTFCRLTPSQKFALIEDSKGWINVYRPEAVIILEVVSQPGPKDLITDEMLGRETAEKTNATDTAAN